MSGGPLFDPKMGEGDSTPRKRNSVAMKGSPPPGVPLRTTRSAPPDSLRGRGRGRGATPRRRMLEGDDDAAGAVENGDEKDVRGGGMAPEVVGIGLGGLSGMVPGGGGLVGNEQEAAREGLEEKQADGDGPVDEEKVGSVGEHQLEQEGNGHGPVDASNVGRLGEHQEQQADDAAASDPVPIKPPTGGDAAGVRD